MANTIKIKRGSGSDPAASDMVLGEPVLRTDTAELFFKKDDGSVAKVSGGGGGPDFKYLALRNAANNGAASFPNADFTLVTSGTTSAIIPTAANTLLVSVNGVIQKPNTGTSTPSQGFALSGSTIKFGANISAAPDFILYQESGGIGEPSDETVSEEKLKVSNSPINGYFLSAQSGNNGGLTWAAPVATSCTGNSATATALETARTINGTSFDGTANITVTAAAGTLTGTTLNSSVVTSSLTSLGDLAGLTVVGNVALDNATNAGRDVQWQHGNDRLAFFDNTKATFGNGADLQIYHDGSHSRIVDEGTGHLILQTSEINIMNVAGNEDMIKAHSDGNVELYFDNSKKFETTSSGGSLTGDWNVSNDFFWFDNGEAVFGNGGDLKIYHNGSNSYIDNHTGDLNIRGNGDDIFLKPVDTEVALKAIPNGAVELYHNNSKKFETNSTGAKVYGSLLVDNILSISPPGNNAVLIKNPQNGIIGFGANNQSNQVIVTTDGHLGITGDSKELRLGASEDLKLSHDGTNSFVTTTTGQLYLTSSSSNVWLRANEGGILTNDGSEYMIRATSNGSVKLFHDNSQKFETTSGGVLTTGNTSTTGAFVSTQTGGGVLSDNLSLVDNKKVKLGTSDDLQIFHDGNDSVIKDAGTGRLSIQTSHLQVANAANSETILNAFENGAVELYHDNSKKFETLSGGAKVTGHFLVTGSIAMDDNVKLKLGTSDDLQIFHNGSHSVIQNDTGTLFTLADNLSFKNNANNETLITAAANGAVELYHNNVKKFETTSSGIDVTGAITVNGSALTGGKILQVVSNVYKTDQTFSTQGSFFDTGLTATITPTSSSSHILVSAQLTFQPHGATTLEFRVLRGSTVLDVGVSGGGSQALVAGAQDGSRGAYPSMQIFDDGISTTSSTTYKVQARVHNANSRINGRDTDYRACSVMTLMEVSA